MRTQFKRHGGVPDVKGSIAVFCVAAKILSSSITLPGGIMIRSLPVRCAKHAMLLPLRISEERTLACDMSQIRLSE